ncbi:Cytochrome P450 76T24 [Euphorbia peplus]|nr:Cytochrome P450 76T24 [Euphorbia peplus]
MTLKLGSITTIVISSPEYAKEALQKHDQTLSGRSVVDAARAYDHHKFSVGWLPALDQWRSLRKVMAMELFSSRKLEASQDIHKKKVQELLVFMGENSKTGEAIDIGQVAFTTILNLISNTVFSIDLASYNSNTSLQFYDAILGIMEEWGKPNLADYFPLLRIMDLQGIRRRSKRGFSRLFEIFHRIIRERLQLKSSSATIKDRQRLLDFLLDISQGENNSELSLLHIKHMLLVSFLFQSSQDQTHN